jgi:hypothetical protein
MERIYIDLPYKLYHDAKCLGVFYDSEKKQCYILDKTILPQFDLVVVDVPFGFSDVARDAGAKFYKEKKQWKTSSFNLSRLQDLLNNDKIKLLVAKELELKQNPTFKIMDKIEKLELMYEKYGIEKI